jgi:hypothetical protein
MMYKFGNIIFNNQKHVLEHIENILEKHFGKNYIDDQNDINFLLDFYRLHYRYKHCINSILYFHVGLQYKYYIISITKNDGKIDFPSKNVFKKQKPDHNLKILTKCLRNAINNEINDFKNNSEKICNSCKQFCDYYDCDHIINFKTILYNFIDENNYENINFEKDVDEIDGKKYLNDNQKEYRIKFENYHKSIPNNLQILCKNCHNKKTFSKNK